MVLKFLDWFNRYCHVELGMACTWILPNDEASSVIYTTIKMRLTITYKVFISISGELGEVGSANNTAAPSSSTKLY